MQKKQEVMRSLSKNPANYPNHGREFAEQVKADLKSRVNLIINDRKRFQLENKKYEKQLEKIRTESKDKDRKIYQLKTSLVNFNSKILEMENEKNYDKYLKKRLEQERKYSLERIKNQEPMAHQYTAQLRGNSERKINKLEDQINIKIKQFKEQNIKVQKLNQLNLENQNTMIADNLFVSNQQNILCQSSYLNSIIQSQKQQLNQLKQQLELKTKDIFHLKQQNIAKTRQFLLSQNNRQQMQATINNLQINLSENYELIQQQETQLKSAKIAIQQLKENKKNMLLTIIEKDQNIAELKAEVSLLQQQLQKHKNCDQFYQEALDFAQFIDKFGRS